jgi:hypothetical protein
MEHNKKRNTSTKPIIDPLRFGVSFSLKQCRDLRIDPAETLEFLLQKIGLRRFRLMSYWNEHEKVRGTYNFTGLDKQISLIKSEGGVVSLCLGVRQPRWPESHWPQWALELDIEARYDALYNFIAAVVDRYKDESAVISWQLENEALNRGFGRNGDFNRARLRREFDLVRSIDDTRQIIMSTSNTWGIPIKKPRPDKFGFTFYRMQYEKNTYKRSRVPWQWPQVRSWLIRAIARRQSFIHELQAEPWGPKAIWEMPISEQDKSMSKAQLKYTIELAKKTKLYPMDLWGGEWWYWRMKHGDNSIVQTIEGALKQSSRKPTP